MRAQDSYAILGLRPGAGRAEVDQAYRRLIKRYHPDQAGGDVGRAAELNRAYSDLRARTRSPQPRSAPAPHGAPRHLPPQRGGPARGGNAGMFVAILALIGVVGGVAIADGRRLLPEPAPSRAALTQPTAKAAQASQMALSMDSPLATGMIDLAVTDAMRFHAAQDPVLAADYSGRCMARLSANPTVPMFDSCTAFDEAIAVLSVDNAAFESGPFSPSTVTARQVGAGRMLAADYLESESRLQQVRSRVHMQLLPRLPDANAEYLIGRRGP